MDWQTIAADVVLLIGATTTFVLVIGGWAKWKGAEKVAKPLRWLHDVLSQVSLGNQGKLGSGDRAPTDKDA